jgi:ATP-dependent RNA helicase DeaD
VAGQQLQIRHDGERSAPVKKAPRKTERTVAPAAERAVAPVAPVAPAAAAAPAPRVTAEPTRAPARPIAEEEAPAKAAATQSSKATDKPKTKPRTATFRIEVGREHGVTPAAIVAALAHDGGIDAKLVGRIELFDRFSLLDLPLGIPPDIARQLKTVRISGRPLRISQGGEMPPLPIKPSGKKAAPRKKDALRKKDAPRKKDGAAPPRKKKKI